MLSLICPFCAKLMQFHDLHDYYCKKMNMRLSIEEQVCPRCASGTMRVLSIGPPEAEIMVGRIESLAVTCGEPRAEISIAQDTLASLVIQHYIDTVESLCAELFGAKWVKGFDIMLWEALENDSEAIQLSAHDIGKIKSLYENIKLWVINPDSWTNIKGGKETYVTIKEWYWMYKNREKLFH